MALGDQALLVKTARAIGGNGSNLQSVHYLQRLGYSAFL